MPWSSAISTVVIASLPMRSSTTRSAPGRRADVERAAGEQRALAHPVRPMPPPSARLGEAAPSSLTRATTSRRRARSATSTRRAGVAGDVRKALLHDAVDRDLLARGRARRAPASRSSVGRHARLAREVADLRAQRGREPVVVERGGAQLARDPQQLLDRLRRRAAASRAARRAAPSGARCVVASRRSSTPVSAWLASSWRSRAMRARSASCAAHHGARRPARARPAGGRACDRRRGAGERPRASRRRGSTGAPPGVWKSTDSIATIRRSSGSKRRRRMSPLTSTVASSAAVSSSSRRSSPLGDQLRATSSVAARTVAAIRAALTPSTWASSDRESLVSLASGMRGATWGLDPISAAAGAADTPGATTFELGERRRHLQADRRSALPPREGASAFRRARRGRTIRGCVAARPRRYTS